MKVVLLILVVVEVSLCFDKLIENLRKIQFHEDEELLAFKGDEYMVQV